MRPAVFPCLAVVAAILLVLGLAPSLVLSQEPTELLISAGASLKDALSDIQTLYQQEQPQVKLTYNFGASGSLKQQIEQGAPVDVFISAAPQPLADLEAKGLILENTRHNLLSNRLVVVVPTQATGGRDPITTLADLQRPDIERIAMGEPNSVPAGQYAEQAIASYQLTEALKPKLIYAKDVRQVLSYVETGNVDVGFVYITDAKVSPQVRVAFELPPESHSAIVYPMAVIKTSEHPTLAQAFVEFLLEDAEVQAIFQKYGFRAPD
ncbi:MAG: molybdate ABC transporter substrate-binding protein [Cyanobacteriota bacterium]|nr:molybdate ABC transporter substrate-binding protein [Cyanobacteriota bacterium]